MTQRHAILLGALLMACGPSPAQAAERWNIVFILADDLGYGDLGCFGQKQIPTPRLDRLASEGCRLTRCYAGSTVCAPSRCVLMTGLHVGHARIRGNAKVPLEPEDVTVAEVLHDAGYRTGAVGKWGLGDGDSTGLPTRQGFDFWFGFLDQSRAHNYYPEFLWRDDHQVRIEGNIAPGGVARQKSQYVQDLFMREALAFLDQQTADRPFFLYLPFTLPHANNEAGRDGKNGMEIPDWGPFADKPWPDPGKGRAAMIHRLDADVGQILDKIDAKGLREKTLVIFTSDNGPHNEGSSKVEFFDSNGSLRGSKRDLYEGGIRVPTIVRGPRPILSAGKVVPEPCGFWDFMATAADVAGVPAPTPTDGRSMLPMLQGESTAEPRPLYWEFHERGFDQAVLLGDWKAVRKGSLNRPIELYDLSVDEGETTDVASAHPEIVARMAEIMKTARTESADWPVRSRH